MKLLMLGWKWKEVGLPFPTSEVVLFSFFISVMNYIIWNSRGSLKPNFQSHVRELARVYDPAIFVIMETRLGGERAKDIIDRLPFDGAIHTDTIGWSGGLWLLWNSDLVEVILLSKTEQEIHVTVKVRSSNISWLFSAVYASPRFAERSILWNNLMNVANCIVFPGLLQGILMSLLLVMIS